MSTTTVHKPVRSLLLNPNTTAAVKQAEALTAIKSRYPPRKAWLGLSRALAARIGRKE